MGHGCEVLRSNSHTLLPLHDMAFTLICPPPPPHPQERQKTLENMGISVQASGIGVQPDKFYLVNLNADPTMNELLVCYLKVGCN